MPKLTFNSHLEYIHQTLPEYSPCATVLGFVILKFIRYELRGLTKDQIVTLLEIISLIHIIDTSIKSSQMRSIFEPNEGLIILKFGNCELKA